MLQAHSFLWNYLWVAPNVLLLILAFLWWKRGYGEQLPSFFAFAIFSAIGDLAVFWADVSPSVSALDFWCVAWASLLIESLLKFIVIGAIFAHILRPYASISRVGRRLTSGFGAVLVLLATLAAASSRGDSTVRLISGLHLVEQTVFIIEMGLVLFLFLFAAYFHLSWDRLSFGVLLGFGISACAHLVGWAISANAEPSAYGRTLLDFFGMAVHHLCVLIWFYYVLVPHRVTTKSPVPLPENNLAVWNRELERLLQQ